MSIEIPVFWKQSPHQITFLHDDAKQAKLPYKEDFIMHASFL